MAESHYSRAQASLAEMLETEPLRLRRRSISLGIHPADADDVAQTVALRAWHSVNGVRGAGYPSLCSWLDVIARNTVTDVARSRSRRTEVELYDDEPSTEDVEFDTEQKDLLERTFTAIRRLPESLRVPLLMSAIEGASADEIAEELGITPVNARQRISRARRALNDVRPSGV